MDPYRDFCRRHHRMIGAFLAIEAWTRGLDCIVLERGTLETLLGLERFKSTRIEWLVADLKPWFAYQKAFYKTRAPSSIGSLFLSRVKIANHLSTGSMTTKERIAKMADDAPRTALYSTKSNAGKVPSLDTMVSTLAIFAAGLAAPSAP